MSLHFKTSGLSVVGSVVKKDSFYGESVTDKKAYRPTSGVAIVVGGAGVPKYDDVDDIKNHVNELVSMRGNFDITEVDAKITKQLAKVNDEAKKVNRARQKVIDDAIADAQIKSRKIETTPSE